MTVSADYQIFKKSKVYNFENRLKVDFIYEPVYEKGFLMTKKNHEIMF